MYARYSEKIYIFALIPKFLFKTERINVEKMLLKCSGKDLVKNLAWMDGEKFWHSLSQTTNSIWKIFETVAGLQALEFNPNQIYTVVFFIRPFEYTRLNVCLIFSEEIFNNRWSNFTLVVYTVYDFDLIW